MTTIIKCKMCDEKGKWTDDLCPYCTNLLDQVLANDRTIEEINLATKRGTFVEPYDRKRGK